MKKILADEAAEAIAAGMEILHLDYSNSIFIGLPKHETSRLRRVQVSAARAVLRRKDSRRSIKQCVHEARYFLSKERSICKKISQRMRPRLWNDIPNEVRQ